MESLAKIRITAIVCSRPIHRGSQEVPPAGRRPASKKVLQSQQWVQTPEARCACLRLFADWRAIELRAKPAHDLGLWAGATHLSPTFDTLGWIFSDLRDAPRLAEGLLGLQSPPTVETRVLIGIAVNPFLEDCETAVLEGYAEWQQRLRSLGANLLPVDVEFWAEAPTLFGMIQAHEAASIHAESTKGDFSYFELSIAERFGLGRIYNPGADRAATQGACSAFLERMDILLQTYEFLIVPCSPVARLLAGADHRDSRSRILRYTTPISLAGAPVVTLPCKNGAGVQLIAACGADTRLLAYARKLGEQFAAEGRASHACAG